MQKQIQKILATVAQIASGSVTFFKVSRAGGMMAPLEIPIFISECHIVTHLTQLTNKPAITRLHQKEPTNPEPPRNTLIRMHVVNRKQINSTKIKQKVAVTSWLRCCPECEERL